MVHAAVKANIVELEEDVREGFFISIGKELTGVVQVLYWEKRFLVRFQDGYKKDLTSNKLTIVIVEKSLVGEEPEVPTIPEMPDY